jgi:hypothetical protein
MEMDVAEFLVVGELVSEIREEEARAIKRAASQG